MDPKQHMDQVRELVARSMGGFWPETVLSILVCVLLVHDLVTKGAQPRRAAWITVAGLVLTGICLLAAGTRSEELFGWIDAGRTKGLVAQDGFALFFKAFILAGTLVTIPMCLTFRPFGARRMGEFYALLVAATLGMFLMAGATNLLMIYLAVEFASMASYLATAFLKQDRKGSEAGLKYVVYGSVASGIMIYGLSLIYGMTGSLHLGDIAAKLSVDAAGTGGFAVAAVLVFAGFAYKMASFPMHFWCPDVYEGAPVPFTAYLSVTSKAAGFAVFIRFIMAFGQGFQVRFEDVTGALDEMGFGWGALCAAAAALSMTVGNVAALWQTNVKRMLAYSSVAQAGYLLMAVAALDPGDRAGGQFAPLLFYFIAYFFMNLGGFWIITLVGAKLGTEEIDGYRGLGRRAPFLAFCLALCLISLLGVPPTGGFTGKMQLFMIAIDRGLVWLAVVAGINTAISAYYYFRLIRAMYLDPARETSAVGFSGGALVLTGILALPVLVLGVAFNPVAAWLQGGSFALGG